MRGSEERVIHPLAELQRSVQQPVLELLSAGIESLDSLSV